MSEAREFWGEDSQGRSTPLAITYTSADAAAVWAALIRARAFVEEREHREHVYKGRFIRSYLEEDQPQVWWASDLEREGIMP